MMTLWITIALLAAPAGGQDRPGTDQTPQDPSAGFEQDLKTLEQQVQAAEWDKASATAERMSQEMAKHKACADCVSYFDEVRTGIRAKDKDKSTTAVARLRTHYEQHHKGKKQE
jgi:hypothetical protein